ncbi:MAG TPA: hypothetical protein VGB24_19835 [Longimicrobium sp.]|uniref:hypothetical protein n=1 Tax=Longimicrobium sp. TaxID=2029185 RepID=UPI002ED8AEF6
MTRTKRSAGLLSRAMLAASIGLFGVVLWTRLAGARGGWAPELLGLRAGFLPVSTVTGAPAQLQHPALIYFFETSCTACTPAASRLNEFASARAPGALPIYALTNSTAFTPDSAALFGTGVQPVRLQRSTRDLRFVQRLPLFVQTDSTGRIVHAFTGIPQPDDLTVLGYPWQASTTGTR